MTFTMTPAAVEYMKKELSEVGMAGDGVRVSIVGGGNSGYQYNLDFDPGMEGDVVLDFDGSKVLIDPESELLLRGTILAVQMGEYGMGCRFIPPGRKVSLPVTVAKRR